VIVVYAGRRAQSIPADRIEAVAERVQRLLTAMAPSALVGAASDGADLLVVEAAQGAPVPVPVHLVLPTDEAVFAQESVQKAWRPRFKQALKRAREKGGGSVSSLGLPDGADAYRAANAEFVEKALDLASPRERVVALVVAAPGEGAIVEDLVSWAGKKGVPVLRIDPSVDIGTRPSCFVAMPYGRKTDVQRGYDLECNRLYHRVLIPALENAQLLYRRADEEIDSGVVLQPMIEWIADADIVIGDLATLNFNVGWELGLRHLLREARTVLMAPIGTKAPFDLASLRHVPYEHGRRGISDSAAIKAWEQLAPYLVDHNAARSDSPVDAVMEVKAWARVVPRQAKDRKWEAIREQLALARDLRDPELMLKVAQRAQGESFAALVRAEAGIGLVRLGRYRDAVALLEEVVAEDEPVRRPDAHHYFAQALYRPIKAPVADLDRAEGVLTDLLSAQPDHPETWAALGAVAKRRSSRRRSPKQRRGDLENAMYRYAHDYERDLDNYYEGVNLVACAAVLTLVFGDEEAGRRARRLLPAVIVAAELATERDTKDYWAAVTLAEARLYEAMLARRKRGAREVERAYAAAADLRPMGGDVDTSLRQLDWLEAMGVKSDLVMAARRGLDKAAR
jgi:tetratricopeptide (TPR) repeat protein